MMTKLKTAITTTACLTVMFSVTTGYPQSSNEETDPVLDFYVEQAEATFTETALDKKEFHYTFIAHTYYKKIGRHGVIKKTDSIISRYFYGGAQVDSIQVLIDATAKMPNFSFSFPNVFQGDYEYNFYPNDIGETLIAIGFDSRSAEDSLPTGIMLIDREKYILKELYLYFPNPEDLKRLTRSYLFDEKDGFVIPASIWEVGARRGILAADYYRLETDITDVQFTR